jgi:hypothetical protein
MKLNGHSQHVLAFRRLEGEEPGEVRVVIRAEVVGDLIDQAI